jgi:hypothetical protein
MIVVGCNLETMNARATAFDLADVDHAVIELPEDVARRPVREVAYHFLPQSVQVDVDDEASCERWRTRAFRALRAAFPGADVSVSYELDVPGCPGWLDVDGNLRPAARAIAVELLDAEFARMTFEGSRPIGA